MKDFISRLDKYKKLILDTQDYIWANPETGYKEYKTSKYLEDVFLSLGYDLIKPDDIPGFYTVIDTGKIGPEILIFCELDALICPTHPDADKDTGAVHSCGHCAQCAALVGVAASLKEPGALEGLCGKIRLCAVPAEELIEIEYRKELRNKGIIKHMGGKVEFLSRGYFDGVDLAFMIHTASGNKCVIEKGGVGCIAKQITYKGKSAHAGGSPWNGINALYAATQGINAVNAIRETMQEQNLIRIHPIITKGGTAVNAIPDTVTLESYVRGGSFAPMAEANKKVNQALIGGALSLGANIDICDIPGYAPYESDSDMISLAIEACKLSLGRDVEYRDRLGTGSSDMGDIACLMPIVQPAMAGATGNGHGSDYYIADPVTACVDSAKWQLAMIHMLLSNKAERATKIIKNYIPLFKCKEAYFSFLEKIDISGDRISYLDNQAKITL